MNVSNYFKNTGFKVVWLEDLRLGDQLKLFPESDFVVLEALKLEEAEIIAVQVRAKVEGCCDRLELVGSIRRRKPEVHDVDFVALTQNDAGWVKIVAELKKLKAKTLCSGKSVIKTLVPFESGFFQVDFYRATPKTLGIHKLVRTGSAEHNMWLASCACSKGMRLQYSQGLIRDGVAVAGEDEKGVFEALDLSCPEPKEREVVGGKPIWL
jgi:DNA polymerase/3'-5' exonuclease PolX